MNNINEIVTVLFEKQRANVLESIRNMYAERVKEVDAFVKANHPFGGPAYHLFFDKFRKSEDWRFYESITELVSKTDLYKPGAPRKLRKGYKKEIEKLVQSDLNTVMYSFIEKMKHKLEEVIKHKQIKDFHSEGMHAGFVDFEFKDGSKFSLNNSVEYGRSKYNVLFQRFPCRYHDVVFSDGSRMKNPSEAKMKKTF